MGCTEKKTSFPHTSVSGVGKAPIALDLFGSASSASEDETIVPMSVPVPCQKHPWKSPPPKLSGNLPMPLPQMVCLYGGVLFVCFMFAIFNFCSCSC
jgi:hypothetical protein